jgi:hypothetical protein
MPRTLSNKQKKIARVASPRNKITGADFKALRKNKSTYHLFKIKLTKRNIPNSSLLNDTQIKNHTEREYLVG